MRTTAAVAMALLMVWGGCGGAGSEPERPNSPRSTEGATRWSSQASQLLALVPPSTTAVMVIDFPRPIWEYLLDTGVLALSDAERKALDAELRAYVSRYQ